VAATGSVTLTPETVVVDEATGDAALRGVSEDGRSFRFDPALAAVRTAAPGSILLLRGRAFGRVTAVRDEGGDLVVDTEPATLTDLVQDGTLEWDGAVDITRGTILVDGGASVTATQVGPVVSLAFQNADEPPPSFTYSGTLDGAYGFDVKFTPAPGRINLDVTIKKSADAPLSVVVQGEGFVELPLASGSLSVSNRVLDRFELDAPVRGELTFKWSAMSKVPGANVEDLVLRLPVKYAIPFAVYGIPMFLELSAAFVITPVFTSKDAFSTAAFKVTYDGNEGFTFISQSISPRGQMDAGPSIVEAWILGLAVQGFTAAIQFPKLSLGVGSASVLNLAAYVDVVTSGMTLTPGALGLRRCQLYELIVSGSAGLTGKMFGLSVPLARTNLFEKRIKETNPPGVNCDP
jgi:hypothetical protein